jgi:hypothetical protein
MSYKQIKCKSLQQRNATLKYLEAMNWKVTFAEYEDAYPYVVLDPDDGEVIVSKSEYDPSFQVNLQDVELYSEPLRVGDYRVRFLPGHIKVGCMEIPNALCLEIVSNLIDGPEPAPIPPLPKDEDEDEDEGRINS